MTLKLMMFRLVWTNLAKVQVKGDKVISATLPHDRATLLTATLKAFLLRALQ